MSHLPLSDREVERLLAGQQPNGRPDLAEVAFFFARLRSLGNFERPPAMTRELRAQVDEQSDAIRRRSVGAGQRRLGGLDAFSGNGADDALELIRMGPDDTRRPRYPWRVLGAAAAVLALGGAVATVGLQGLRDQPEVESRPGRSSVEDSPTATTEPPAIDPTGPSGDVITGGDPPAPALPEQPDVQTGTTEAPVTTTTTSSTTTTTTTAPRSGDRPSWWPDECPPDDWHCVVQHFDDPPGH